MISLILQQTSGNIHALTLATLLERWLTFHQSELTVTQTRDLIKKCPLEKIHLQFWQLNEELQSLANRFFVFDHPILETLQLASIQNILGTHYSLTPRPPTPNENHVILHPEPATNLKYILALRSDTWFSFETSHTVTLSDILFTPSQENPNPIWTTHYRLLLQTTNVILTEVILPNPTIVHPCSGLVKTNLQLEPNISYFLNIEQHHFLPENLAPFPIQVTLNVINHLPTITTPNFNIMEEAATWSVRQ